MDTGEEVKQCLPGLETPTETVDNEPVNNLNSSLTAETLDDGDGKSASEPPSENLSVCPPLALNDSSTEYQEIDPVSSKSTSVSEVEEGQILDSSSDASDLIGLDQPRRSLLKRSNSALSDIENGTPKKQKKKISFSAVTAYYFPRAQGFTCVPSQGGSTLGMALKHSHEEILTLNEHANQQRQKHRRWCLNLQRLECAS